MSILLTIDFCSIQSIEQSQLRSSCSLARLLSSSGRHLLFQIPRRHSRGIDGFSIVTSFWKPLTRSVSSHHSSIVQVSRQNSSMTCFILLVHLIRAMKRSWESASDGSLRRRLNIERLFEEDNADRLGDRSEQKMHRLIRVVEREKFFARQLLARVFTRDWRRCFN